MNLVAIERRVEERRVKNAELTMKRSKNGEKQKTKLEALLADPEIAEILALHRETFPSPVRVDPALVVLQSLRIQIAKYSSPAILAAISAAGSDEWRRKTGRVTLGLILKDLEQLIAAAVNRPKSSEDLYEARKKQLSDQRGERTIDVTASARVTT